MYEFPLGVAKIENVFTIKGISEYGSPCSFSIHVHSTVSILSLSEFRYFYYLLTIKED